MAAQMLERGGVGKRVAINDYRRGTVQVREITALHPLTKSVQPLYHAGKPMVHAPGLPVSPADVASHAATLSADQITMHFKTPLRLIDNGHLVKRITLRPLIQRLMRRLDDLSLAYGDGSLGIDFRGLLDVAEQVQTSDDHTHWVDLTSYSSRQRTHTPIGGLTGYATFTGDLTPLRELLIWGSLIHVGKNAVKGDGWYEIMTTPASA